MTDPTQAKTVQLSPFKTARRYSWPPHPPHEFTVTSVTTAIKHGLPAPHLIGWAAKKTAECAIADHDIIGAMLAKGDKKAAIAHVKGSRYRDMDAKASRGTVVHAAVDAYLKGNPLSKKGMEQLLNKEQVPPALWHTTAGMIAGAMAFLWDNEPEVYLNEATVYSRDHLYGGTPDLIGSFHIGGSRLPAVVDFKTSPNIYDEVALQLVAYARANFAGGDDGSELPLVPDGKSIDYGIVVRPKADGTYERATFTLDDSVFNLFLSVLGTATGVEDDVLARSRRPSSPSNY